jgi:phage-related baseplate assembly protein
MSQFSPIDLSQLAAPNVVEQLDFEQILAERKTALLSLYPVEEQADIAARLQLESEPLTKLLQENAYRELLLRQRINDATRAVMLAFAKEADLDHLGAMLEVARLLISPADLTAVPPVPAVYEADSRFRQRIQLALEGFTTAGSVGAYTFHALSASAVVKDVDISSSIPGIVTVTVLSTAGDGTPAPELLSLVNAALNAEDVRPLCDTVEVLAAQIHAYTVAATLTFYQGPDMALVRAAAEAAVRSYVDAHHRLGHDITRSGLFAALHQPGVQNVQLSAPADDVVIDHATAAWCSAVTVSGGLSDE